MQQLLQYHFSGEPDIFLHGVGENLNCFRQIVNIFVTEVKKSFSTFALSTVSVIGPTLFFCPSFSVSEESFFVLSVSQRISLLNIRVLSQRVFEFLVF